MHGNTGGVSAVLWTDGVLGSTPGFPTNIQKSSNGRTADFGSANPGSSPGF